MEIPQLIWCVLLPAVVATITCLGGWCLERRWQQERLATTVVSLGWTAAVFVGLLGIRRLGGDESSLSWPDDFWQRGYWGMLAVSLFLPWTLWGCCCLTCCCGAKRESAAAPQRDFASLRWIVAAVLLFSIAAIALPSGEAWEDTYPLHRTWLVWLGSWGLVIMYSLEKLAIRPGVVQAESNETAVTGPQVVWRGTQRWWPLVVLASLAGVVYVTGSAYSALLMWALSAVAATVVCVLFGLAVSLRSTLGIAYPATVLSLVLFAAGRFYSYEDHSLGSYVGFLVVAPAIGLVDCWLERRVGGQRHGLRAVVAAIVASALLGWSIFSQWSGAS